MVREHYRGYYIIKGDTRSVDYRPLMFKYVGFGDERLGILGFKDQGSGLGLRDSLGLGFKDCRAQVGQA